MTDIDRVLKANSGNGAAFIKLKQHRLWLTGMMREGKEPCLCVLKGVGHICDKTLVIGKDYSGTKFFYTEPLSLNKAQSTK